MLAQQTAQQLSQEWKMLFLDLDTIPDQEIMLNKIPSDFMEKYHVLVLSGQRIVIHDPAQQDIIQQIYFYLGESGCLWLADKTKLQKRIAALLHHQERNHLLQDDQASMVDYTEKLLSDAVNKKASDIHLETDANNLIVRFRIDGMLYEITRLSRHFSARIITHLKVLAQLDITEKRLPQDGRFRLFFKQHARYIDFRLNTCPTIYEEKLVLRILNTHTQYLKLELEYLEFSPDQKKRFLSALAKPQGMVLVTGPTGSGKTVTLYTALNLLNQSHVNILSVEDPVEIELAGINQVQINPKIDLTFSRALRAFLRQDPDIIMIGEMRDKETADIAIKAAQTGHLVLSTLHTNSAAETLSRLINMGIPAYDIAASVSLMIAQRLVRRLCENCKIPDILSPAYYQAAGCPECQDGYAGRMGVYEFLPVTSSIAKHILRQSDITTLQQKAREEGMQTLRENGLEKVQMGLTSLSELSRVMR